ncbi:GNAT family N-acetyltransferase [Aquirufa sp. OSTEICH-129A]
MKGEFLIRRGTLEDAREILSLLEELENRQFNPIVFQQILEGYLINSNIILLVIENSTKSVLGFLSAIGQNLLHHGGMVYEIQELIVTASYQGRGLGSLLIEALQSELKDKDVKSIEVTSNKRRKEAHAFYEAMGFKNSHEKFTIYF